MQVIVEGELCPALRLPPCDGALTAAERSWLPLPEDACGQAVEAGGWCVAELDVCGGGDEQPVRLGG